MDQQENLVEQQQPQQPESETMTMQEALEQYEGTTGIRKGETRTGTVLGIAPDGGVLIDVGFKCEGIIPLKEWTHRPLIEDENVKPKPGDQIKVEVVSVRNGEEAQLVLNRWHQEFDKRWAALEEALNGKTSVQVKGLAKVKGGLSVECCGLEGFIPVSHLTLMGRGVNPANFAGKMLEVKLLDKDKRKHRLLFSRRDLLEEAEKAKKEAFYETIHEGDIREGEVNSTTDFGVFVTLGTMDGLVHVTEITWKRNFKMREMFKKGDKVTVKVIGIDREHDRISLSIKQVSGDPWENVTERIKVGETVKGVITNMTDFGAFVEIEPGIEGLIHVGDISWKRIKKPRDVFKKGQEVEAQVLEIDTEKRRISLGCKQLNDPWQGIEERYKAGQDIQVKVVRLAAFGAFVQVEEGVEALIHISQLSHKRVEKPGDVLQEGQEVTTRILEVNPEQRRMRLSLKALEEVPEPEPGQELAPEGMSAQPAQRRQNRRDDRRNRGEEKEQEREFKANRNNAKADGENAKRPARANKAKARTFTQAQPVGYTDEDNEALASFNPFAALKDFNLDENNG